ncbi:uncharacterized protein LOC112506762 [Cynara cardunculus var. scolymus]|uniref:uncharacterized protein LOC112506762 n=1 Tax=Cynara cardunculus var. scolymus TaxID=59895 RepID=UPI000D62CA96|nr:uncharacterized protein LOC112506762 [Cynara cardunculus var. scolymus]
MSIVNEIYMFVSIHSQAIGLYKEKVAEVLDTIGSRLSSLNSVGEFVSITASRSNTVSILAFEVANTIVKGSNLMQSLSKENIQIFKKEILHSEGVQLLVSTDMKKLLSIAAADKREELEVFSRDVVRFGNLCIDPQWHNLDRYLERLNWDLVRGTNKQLQKKAEITMQKMANLAKHTSELYHELEALDKMEQHYRRRLEEVQSLHLLRKGKSELKHHKKLVRKLKKRSLWPIILEEVVEKLADVVIFIHQEISEAFENDAHSTMNGKSIKEPERLGVTGLALHYANLITQMNCIASRPTCLIPNMRVTLYNNLPASVKSELRSSLQALDSPEVMTVSQIKAEMDKTLNWLVPLATDTTKAHHGFGFVGEWANTGNEFGTKTAGSNNIIRLQTLYYADKQTMDLYILDLIILLHRLISLTRYKDDVSSSSKGLNPHHDGKLKRIQISSEDKNLSGKGNQTENIGSRSKQLSNNSRTGAGEEGEES